MKYQNGRDAQEGDSVIGTAWIEGGERVVAGTVQRLIPGGESCDAVLVVPVVGGKPVSLEVKVGELIHAEDAFLAFGAESKKTELTEKPKD